MLLVALQHIPGPISIVPGQQFYEPNDEQRANLIRTGFARPAEAVLVAQESAAPPRAPSRTAFPDWRYCRVVIIASGPSLTEEQCAQVASWYAQSHTHKVVAINTSFRRAPFADMLYACDTKWWDAYYEEVIRVVTPTTLLFTQDKPAAQKYELGYIASVSARGLSRKPGLIHQGMSSGFQAINLAFLAGVRDFVLLGYDCRGTHWHGDHPPPLKANLPHARWIEHFAVLARDLREEGVRILNCSPGTAIPEATFPRADLAAALGGTV